jgi:hypothetical protein
MNCFLCGNKATGRFTPDLDIKGIPYCDKHYTDIQIALLMMDEDPKALERLQKKYKGKKKC